MTQEQQKEKLALFCKYLPYGVEYLTDTGDKEMLHLGKNGLKDSSKLLLRPLESLTDEEWLGVFKKGMVDFKDFLNKVSLEKDRVGITADWGDSTYLFLSFTDPFTVISHHDNGRSISDFKFNHLLFIEALYALHLDIHGAIKKGFAVDKKEVANGIL